MLAVLVLMLTLRNVVPVSTMIVQPEKRDHRWGENGGSFLGGDRR